jgi:hypothetical protein
MKIKNTRELRLRAAAHTKLDHVKQGTYGRVRCNGHAEYKGCAVGCLSTPHRKRDLLKFAKEVFASSPWLSKQEGAWVEVRGIGYSQREALAAEFGICERLGVMAEGFFEAQITHSEAIDFIRDFAYALPEGIDIDEEHCRAFLRREGLPEGGPYGLLQDAVRVPRNPARTRELTEGFLQWLRAGARVSKMPRREAVAA